MAPNGWATPEKTALLTGLLPEYEKCQVTRQYKPFWTILYSTYLKEFPLINDVFEGKTLNELDEGQMAIYTLALEKLQSRLREWYRWRCNARSRKIAAVVPAKILKSIYSPRTRGPKAYEAYAKLYPEEWHVVCKELYTNASEEKLKAVDDLVEVMGKEKDNVEDAPTDTKKVYIQVLPTILKAAVEPAVRRAGLMALITLVGPTPESHGKFELGHKEDTPLFSSSWVDHDILYVEAVARFAKRYVFSQQGKGVDPAQDDKDIPRPSPAEPAPGKSKSPVGGSSDKELPPEVQETHSLSTSAGINQLLETRGLDHSHEPASHLSALPSLSSSAGKAPLLDDADLVNPSHGPASQLFPFPLSSTSAGSSPLLDDGDLDESVDPGHRPASQLFPFPLSSTSAGSSLLLDYGDLDASTTSSTNTGKNLLLPDGYREESINRDFTAHLRLPSPPRLPERFKELGPLSDISSDEWSNINKSLEGCISFNYGLGGSDSGCALENTSLISMNHATSLPGPPLDLSLMGQLANQSTTSFPTQPWNRDTHTIPHNDTVSHTQMTFPGEYRNSSRPTTESAGTTPPIEPAPSPQLNQTTPIYTERSTFDNTRLSPFSQVGISGLDPPESSSSADDGHQTTLANAHSGPTKTSDSAEHTMSNLVLPDPLNQTNSPTTNPPLGPVENPSQSLVHGDVHIPNVKPRPRPIGQSTNHSPLRTAEVLKDLLARNCPHQDLGDESPPESSPSPAVVAEEAPASAKAPCTTAPLPASLPTASHSDKPGPSSPPPSLTPHPLAKLPDVPQPPQTSQFKVVAEAASLPQHTELALSIESEPVAHPALSPVNATASGASSASPALSQASLTPPTNEIQSAHPTPSGGSAVTDIGPDLDSPAVRRSTRGNVPSKTRERLQNIGTNVLNWTTPKLIPTDDPLTPPAWFASATGDLRDTSLGSEWVALVDKWSDLEQSLGFGKLSKGSMPVKGRPEEWTRWTNKSAHGARNHSRPPFIDDPAEIGISITKWWSSIQPAFRASNGTMPAPVYLDPNSTADVWGPLRKSGPNGTLALMMLMLWWGRAAAPGPENFREDSRGSWKALIADITSSFNALLATYPSQRFKRGLEDVAPSADPDPEIKRKRFVFHLNPQHAK
ncbi:hypothetical protein DFP72DRAFT_1082426 [Ephemerocybe angulata]|uniref:Uncharacterized protein n=2 Tax=Ephemerocybe angulata TaxID=980116 RepID=A0A8H6HAF5_9AGAR|nr:hypothetical protein DFP72DRAFT_1082426 [Tulosesus angulatus]